MLYSLVLIRSSNLMRLIMWPADATLTMRTGLCVEQQPWRMTDIHQQGEAQQSAALIALWQVMGIGTCSLAGLASCAPPTLYPERPDR